MSRRTVLQWSVSVARFARLATGGRRGGRSFEAKSLLIGERIDSDDQRHAFRIERVEAGQAVLARRVWFTPPASYFG